jgi:hypothetical protein
LEASAFAQVAASGRPRNHDQRPGIGA